MKSGPAVLAVWFYSLWKNECVRLKSLAFLCKGSYDSLQVNYFRQMQPNEGEVESP